MIVAAIPVKDLESAKQRLIPVLSPSERRELARAMLEDVLGVLSAVPRIGLRGVVSPDAEKVESRLVGSATVREFRDFLDRGEQGFLDTRGAKLPDGPLRHVRDGDRAIMVPMKRDLWSLQGALKKYAKGKKFDWKKIRREVHLKRAQRQVRILEESRGAVR
jgi:hypothetical protein